MREYHFCQTLAEKCPNERNWVYCGSGEFWRCGGAVYDGYLGSSGGNVCVAPDLFGVVCCYGWLLVGAAEGEEEDGVVVSEADGGTV